METLLISKDNALVAYQAATSKQKALLSNLFGEKVFKKSVKDRVKSYQDACEDLGIEPLKLTDFSGLPESDQKHAYASHKLTIIIRALNEGWIPDYSNVNEPKYYGYFKYSGSGSGFSYDGCAYDDAYSGVGARLSLKSRDLAEYAGKQFIKEYNDYLSI